MESKQDKKGTDRKKQRAPRTKPPVPTLEVLSSAELVPVRYYPLVDPSVSDGSLRWKLFNRDHNGLAASGAVVKHGHRLLIDPPRFRAWLRAGGSANVPTSRRYASTRRKGLARCN